LNEAKGLALLREATQGGQGAALLLQHSSRKPTAQSSGSPAAALISRSRLLFSFVQGIGGGDPAFGPLPAHSEEARQGGPDSLPLETCACA
jgi:hypothetical protein